MGSARSHTRRGAGGTEKRRVDRGKVVRTARDIGLVLKNRAIDDHSGCCRRRPVPKLERDDYERSREVGTERVKALQGRVAAVDGDRESQAGDVAATAGAISSRMDRRVAGPQPAAADRIPA